MSAKKYDIHFEEVVFHLLKPLGDRIVIELVEAEEKTLSGIVLPDSAKEKPQEAQVVAGVLHLHDLVKKFVAVHLLRRPAGGHPVDVLLRGAQAVDAGHRRDDDDVAPGQQRAGRASAAAARPRR